MKTKIDKVKLTKFEKALAKLQEKYPGHVVVALTPEEIQAVFYKSSSTPFVKLFALAPDSIYTKFKELCLTMLDIYFNTDNSKIIGDVDPNEVKNFEDTVINRGVITKSQLLEMSHQLKQENQIAKIDRDLPVGLDYSILLSRTNRDDMVTDIAKILAAEDGAIRRTELQRLKLNSPDIYASVKIELARLKYDTDEEPTVGVTVDNDNKVTGVYGRND